MRTSRKEEILISMKHFLLPAGCIVLFSCSSPQLESGKANEVKQGSKFHVNLPEDHTTLYLWSLKNEYDPEVIQYMGSVFRSNEKGVDFNFEAGKPGRTEITFYLRSYNDTSATKTFSVEVK